MTKRGARPAATSLMLRVTLWPMRRKASSVEQIAGDLVVVDDEDGAGIRGVLLHRPGGGVFFPRRAPPLVEVPGHRGGEGGALPRHAAHGERAPEQLREPATAAVPGRCPSRLLVGAVDLRELLEDALLVRGGDAHAGVAHREHHAVAGAAPGAHPHLAPLGELERVGDEVAQDLRHLSLVGEQQRQLLRLLDDERTPSSARRGRSIPRSVASSSVTAKARGPHLRLAGLDLRQVQQVVDELAAAPPPTCG